MSCYSRLPELRWLYTPHVHHISGPIMYITASCDLARAPAGAVPGTTRSRQHMPWPRGDKGGAAAAMAASCRDMSVQAIKNGATQLRQMSTSSYVLTL